MVVIQNLLLPVGLNGMNFWDTQLLDRLKYQVLWPYIYDLEHSMNLFSDYFFVLCISFFRLAVLLPSKITISFSCLNYTSVTLN